MDGNSTGLLIGIVILIFFSAYFSASETAFTSLNRTRMKSLANAGDVRAARALALSENYDKLISTILIANNIVNILSASLATVIFTRWLGNAGVTVSTVVITIVVLLFGEIAPKSIAKQRSEKIAMLLSPSLIFFTKLLMPLNFLMMQWQKLLSRRMSPADEQAITEEELLTLVEEAESEGGINEHEGELIRSAIEFDDLSAEDILTPRVDIYAIDKDAPRQEIRDQFAESGFSRLPVYEENIDDIIGILHEKDFFLNPDKPIDTLMTTPICVHPSIKLPKLLRLLQRTKSHLAVIMDEYGGVMGIVTMEDILEELVGEIWDEHDEVVEEFTKLPDGSYSISCSANLDKMLELFDIDREYESSTVSGWVVEELGHFPQVGDSFEFEGMKVTVEKIDGRRVLQIRVEMPEKVQE